MRKHLSPGRTVAAALVCGALAGAASAQPVDEVLDALSRVKTFRGVAISPDGKLVAWSEHRNESGAGKSELFVSELGVPAAPRRITAAKKGAEAAERDAVFSPDGARVAFLSDADVKGQLQVYVADVRGGAPSRVTSAVGDVSSPRFSPDGRSVAFLLIENSSRGAGPLGPSARDQGVVAEKPEERRIALVDLASKKTRLVSPADLYVYEYDFAPDGSAFAATAAKGSGDDNWWVAEMMLVDAASGAARTIYKPPPELQIADPRFSPDGSSVAFIGGIMSDQGSTGGDVWVLPRAGGAPRNLTPGMKASASTLRWISPETILFGEEVGGDSGLATVSKDGGPVATLFTGAEHLTTDHLTGAALAKDGKTSAVVRESFTAPPEVWAGAIGSWTQVTHANAAVTVSWGAAKKMTWASDGTTVHGWLLAPAHPAADRKSPLVVVVHGGPAGLHRAGWPSRWNGLLASQGYYVFLPNPRGSFGEGEEFTRGNVKDFGYGDLRDVLRGLDAVLASEPVDPARIGVTGWSYGGYMTMWAITQTNRFAAAVAGAGIVNWQSYYGQNRIDQWMLPFFGASVYDDPAVYAKSSPITFIKNVKTPTLVLHGDRDSEVPTPQGYEFWHALKTLGVPTQLVVYENEGHAVSKPEHLRDIQVRTLEWFDRFLE